MRKVFVIGLDAGLSGGAMFQEVGSILFGGTGREGRKGGWFEV